MNGHARIRPGGTRGLGAAHHALLGSAAWKDAGHSPVPVVLVK
ncbi:MAG TPA: hypothetical protein VJ797_05155 [Burkholderiales bacterium]|nr:hypothetical protein [Burkholderiales bacterium]